MENFTQYMSSLLTEKGKLFKFKNESFLNTIDLSSNDAEIYNKILKALSDKLVSEVNNSYNVINPIYKEFVEYVNTKTSEIKVVPSYARYNIKEFVIPEFIKAVIKEDRILEPRAVKDTDYPPTYIGKPETPQEYLDLFTYKKASIDSMLEDIRSMYKPEDLIEVFDKYISNVCNKDTLNYLSNYKFECVNDICLVYTALTNLHREKPVWVPIEDKVYNDLISNYLTELSNLISLYNSFFRFTTGGDKLVINCNKDGVVLVNKPIYEKYLEEGNKIEAIFGLANDVNLSKDTTKFNLAYILQEQNNLIKKWEIALSAFKLTDFNNMVDRYKVCYQLGLEYIFKNVITTELKEEHKLNYIELDKRLQELLANKNADIILDINKTSIFVIGCIVFPGTGYYEIANGIIKYINLLKEESETDEVKTNVASLFSTVEFLLNFLLSQVEVTSTFNG